jgi:hypothetical protein
MAEANMMSMAGALARCGCRPFVHTFGVFATRRPYDQIANAIACPNLPARIVGFMPGVSTPGGLSHQATEAMCPRYEGKPTRPPSTGNGAGERRGVWVVESARSAQAKAGLRACFG